MSKSKLKYREGNILSWTIPYYDGDLGIQYKTENVLKILQHMGHGHYLVKNISPKYVSCTQNSWLIDIAPGDTGKMHTNTLRQFTLNVPKTFKDLLSGVLSI